MIREPINSTEQYGLPNEIPLALIVVMTPRHFRKNFSFYWKWRAAMLHGISNNYVSLYEQILI